MGTPTFAAYLPPAELEHSCALLASQALLRTHVCCLAAASVAASNQKTGAVDGEAGSSERCSSDHFVLSCWWQSNLSRLGVVVVMTSLLIKCQIYARCCGQNSHVRGTVLPQPLGHRCHIYTDGQPLINPCSQGSGGTRRPCLPREALGFPIPTLTPENGPSKESVGIAKLPFPGKALCSPH